MHVNRADPSPSPTCPPPEHHRYQSPRLQRFGDFRRLTRVGTDADGDGGVVFGINDGCNLIPDGECRIS
jgi:hypothetical protein